MEFQSLYRTYRPQQWDEVVGQERIMRTLMNEVRTGSLAHAFLFCGPRGVGKTTTARLLARTLNCTGRAADAPEPCGSCPSCTSIREGRSVDVLEIDAASHTGVDNVREAIIGASRIAPLEQKNRIFIIDEVHMLSNQAFNALLKTLEEPPANVYFILATTESDRIPETIISRCQRFDFRRMPSATIVERLAAIAKKECVKVEASVLEDIARNAEGGMRDAESMLGQLFAMGGKKITAEEAALVLPKGDLVRAQAFCAHLLGGQTREAFALLTEFLETGGDADAFVRDGIRIARTALQAAVIGNNTPDRIAGSPEALTHLLRRLLAAADDMRRMDPPELGIELLIAEYAHRAENADRADTADTKAPPAPKPAPPIEKPVEKKQAPKVPPSRLAATDQVAEPLQPLLTLTLDAIRARWHDVLATAKKYNHSLALILKVAQPLAVQADEMTLGFQHAFHIERLGVRSSQDVACRVLAEVYGSPFRLVRGELASISIPVSVAPAPASPNDPLLASVLETFGGTVVGKG